MKNTTKNMETLSKFSVIQNAINGVKNGLTLKELCQKTGMNENTARRELGEAGFQTKIRKCRVTKSNRKAYMKFDSSLLGAAF